MTNRIIIIGGPKTGKTTLSETYESTHTVRHTDDLNGKMKWSEESEEVARWFAEPGDWVIEGTTTVRALRKWLEAHPGSPCEEVIFLPTAHQELSKQQANLSSGIKTIWAEILPLLKKRQVKISIKH